MTTISVLPETSGPQSGTYRAVAGKHQAVGDTIGQALDALAPQLDTSESATLVVLQRMRPDRFFTAEQQQRLQELMTRWRAARDTGTALPAEEQTELEALVEAEIHAAGLRAAALLREATS